MWLYWMMFIVPAFLAVSSLQKTYLTSQPDRWTFLWRMMFVFVASIVGLRHEVGGDWFPYLHIVDAAGTEQFVETFVSGEPAYKLINWIAAHSSLGVYLLNSVFSVLFTFGLMVFCRNQTRPWLALVVAVPYLITVVAMGYSRQGVAIGFAMLGLVALANKNVLKFMLWVGIAALFHKTAVILIPLAVLTNTRWWLLKLLSMILTCILMFVLLLQEAVDSLIAGYIAAEYDSSGAAIRVAMNAVPAVLFLLYRKRFALAQAQFTFWTWMAWGAIGLQAILFVSPSSTAVDRVALYWIPLQLFVWSRFPDAMGRSGEAKALWVYLIIAYSATVHIVWLFLSTHAYLWLPYQFYPWVWLWL